MTIADLTNGRWPDLLAQLAGLTPEQLTDKHQPCPLCGGKDRYRFDDQDGTGSWYCNQCGGKDQSGGGGTGIDMLMRRNNWAYPEACRASSSISATCQSRPPRALSTFGITPAHSLFVGSPANAFARCGGMECSGYGKPRQHLARYMASST
jgi:phage/plasmid primase-like uncharacterized protein